VVEAIKAKGRVAAIVVGNASVASFDEGVLTLRFPRQGDVKGFQGSKYEELLKQAINAMFGVNVVIRSVTGGGDAAAPARRQGPPPAPPAPDGQPPAPGPSPGPPQGQAPGQPPPDYPAGGPSAAPYSPGGPAAQDGRVPAAGAAPPGGRAGNGGGEGPHPFGSPVSGGGDLPPLPPPPAPDDDEFDPDDEDMSVPAVNQLTGMALVRQELGGQVIAEYED